MPCVRRGNIFQTLNTWLLSDARIVMRHARNAGRGTQFALQPPNTSTYSPLLQPMASVDLFFTHAMGS